MWGGHLPALMVVSASTCIDAAGAASLSFLGGRLSSRGVLKKAQLKARDGGRLEVDSLRQCRLRKRCLRVTSRPEPGPVIPPAEDASPTA